MQIGNGLSEFDATIGLLQDGAGSILEIQTTPITFDGSTGLVLDNPADIQSLFLEADGSSWSEADIDLVQVDGNLYGTDGNSAPTAAELVNGEIDLRNGANDEAYIDFSTSKIELHNQ
jgi:hypothetical protein